VRRQSSAARQDYENGLVAMAVTTGFPWMMARVLFALLVSPGNGLTAAALTQHLAVSPASVSRAVRDLESLGFLRRQVTERHRSEYYALEEHAWQRVWTAQAKGVRRWAEEFPRGLDLFGADHPTRAGLLTSAGSSPSSRRI
jgi:predicted transcriptional regulator